MHGNVTLAVTAVIAVCAYYLFAWMFVGRDPKIDTLVATYDPPRGLSPAMIRYVWKQGFDDRTFWAGILSLVAKGLGTLQVENGTTHLRPLPSANAKQSMPMEEEILLSRLFRGKTRKGIVINMLDAQTALAASDMAVSLRESAVGRWFQENRIYVTVGLFLSAVAVVAVAQPRSAAEWGVLGLSFVLMAPSAFYFFFLAMRAKDIYRALRQCCTGALLRRGAIFLFFSICCIAGIVFGSVVLAADFGWPLIAITIALAILNILQLRWMMAPTAAGARLLTEIEGFRHFLQTVEHLPLSRTDAPGDRAGLYEKYLPYAIALEVEQAWVDQFVALSSTVHQEESIPGAESFYLGLWDGKPVEITYAPQRR